MKYIRTYGDYNSWKSDYASPSRGFRLKPTLYKYPHGEDNILLELDDPRKYRNEGSTYMEITLDSDTMFSFYIGNASDNTETTMDCRVDWGDGTVDESLSITADDKGFKLSHSYKAGSYSIELHKVARDYSIIGDTGSYKSLISHPSSVKRVILGEGNNYGVGGVVSVGAYTFDKCSSLTSIHIPEGVTSIGDSAFESCTSLTSILISEGVVSIGEDAFRSCSSLTSIHIPESVTSIGDLAFYNCHSLTSAYIPSRVTIIEGTFRSCESLTSVHIPESVTSIGDRAFASCTSLTSIHIPEGVTSIGGSAFNGCTGLTSIHIPEGVTSIGGSAFTYCTSLTSVNIPEGVTSISNVFSKCSSLTSILIPERVTEILNYAFDGCTSLISISSLNTTAPTLGLFDSGQYTIFTGLPTNGTLHIKPGATGYDVWLYYLPEGWRIVEDL